MKKAAQSVFLLFLLSLVYTSCKENEYMDWKLINDRFYATLEDTVARYDTLKLRDSMNRVVYQKFHKTTSGIYYQIIHHDSTGRHPSVNNGDYVNVLYKGILVDKTVFDSAKTTFTLSGTVEGFQEMMHMMTDGSHYVFYLPYNMGYGSSDSYSSIPPYSVLRFDVRLLESN